MILRRIAEGIKNQDWFVVLIEIFIVVIGIYIGLQVDDWNKLRQEKAASDEYITSLHADVISDIEMLEALKERVFSRRRSAEVVLKILDSDGTYEGPGLFVRQLDFMARIRFPNYETTTYEEMVATGSMQVLADDLRVGIARYYRFQVDENATNDLQERRVYGTYLPMMVEAIPLNAQRWAYDFLDEPMSPRENPEWIPAAATEALQNIKQNPNIRGAIKAVIRGTWTQEQVVNRMLERAKNLLDAIEEETQ